MQMCTGHWEMLKEETLSLGLGDWIATSGETAALQQADQISRQEPTRLNFDPLMDAHNDDFRSEYNVWNNASSIAVHELIASLHDQWRCGELSDNYVLLELFKLLNLSRTKV